ncbi:MAG TPA: hypothetical protein VJ810_29695 [Blastocatellia bacterium]|nr:hypothetical protein [Blastocatellia bacterium]
MKKRIAFLSVCFVFTALSLAWAADVNGKWVAQVPGRDGQTRETTFTFKVEDGKLTGSVSGRQGDSPISDGKIEGDNISFSRKLNAGGNDITINYKGKVSGDEIKFSVTREGADQAQEFTAKRAK